MNFNLGLPTAINKGLDANTYGAFTSGIDNSATQWQQGQDSLATGDVMGKGAGDVFARMAGTAPGTLETTDLTSYMNPFTRGVIDPTMDELNRQEKLQQQGVDASAEAQNAFGGDRMQIQKAAMNRDFDVTRKSAIADLYRQNFDQAREGAKFDISGAREREAGGARGLADVGGGYMQQGTGLGSEAQGGMNNWANMGFGWGTDLNNQQLAAGGLQQQQQQQIMDAIKAQFGGFTDYPDTAIERLTGSTPSPGNAGTTSKKTTPSLAGTIASILGF